MFNDRVKELARLGCCLLATLVLISCEGSPAQKAADTVPLKPASNVAPPAAKGVDVPLPQLGAFAAIDPSRDSAWEQLLNRKPPFYSGPMPLKYTSIRRETKGSDYYVLSDRFGAWRNDYSYDSGDPIAHGARAIDSAGTILAEARFLGVALGKALEVEEYHYSNGKVTFYSRSRFTPGGYKHSEETTQGAKEHDYFFMWPTGRR